MIQNNMQRCHKTPRAVSAPGEKIRVIECRNEACEVSYVVDSIKNRRAKGASLSGMAVLYRTQKTGRQFQEELRRQQIPFNVHGVSFWRRKIIKSFIAVLRLVTNCTDDQAFRRLFKAFLYQDKEGAKSILAHLEKIAKTRKSSLWMQGKQCLEAKVSGAISRKNMVLGRKMISRVEKFMTLAKSQPCIVGFAETVLTFMPESHKYDACVAQEEGATLLNEGKDSRTVREVLVNCIRCFQDTWKASSSSVCHNEGKGQRLAEGEIRLDQRQEKRKELKEEEEEQKSALFQTQRDDHQETDGVGAIVKMTPTSQLHTFTEEKSGSEKQIAAFLDFQVLHTQTRACI